MTAENSSQSAIQSASDDYGADAIKVLEGLEAVRKRPGMYIGDTGVRGLHHLVFEVVDNSIDEALAGSLRYQVNVTSSTSTDQHHRRGQRARHSRSDSSHREAANRLPKLCSPVLHAGGKFDNDSPIKSPAALHGVGVSVVNALSETGSIVEIWRNGQGVPTDTTTARFTPSAALADQSARRNDSRHESNTSSRTPRFSRRPSLQLRHPRAVDLRELAFLNRRQFSSASRTSAT